MTYKELLNLYKTGELSDAQKAKVEKDIEKQEAISEFLFENDEIPQFKDSCFEAGTTDDNNNMDEKRFQKMIKRSIRKAFIKLGVTVGIVVLALVLGVNTALPYIVDTMYYNPTKIVDSNEGGNETNQITLDTMVYTELFTPGYYRIDVRADSKGFGKYDIRVLQNFSKNGQIKNAYGTIDKGRLTMFDDAILKRPPQNAFVSDDIKDFFGYVGAGAAGHKENALNKLNELNDEDYYIGYVTFNTIMSYDQLVAWSDESGIVPDWCAVCRYQGPEHDSYVTHDIMGFNYLRNGNELSYDKEKYPYLNYYDVLGSVNDSRIDNISAEVMESHFTSLLRYTLENKTFSRMAGTAISDDELKMYIDSIETHGLFIYGFVVTAQKDKLLETSKNENVHYIYTTPLM